jgi:SAM-dependent methyltransferase
MQWLREKLPELRPDLHFEAYGFDVSDHGVSRDSRPAAEGVSWISISDPWPYPDNFFQVVISNQVLEHVATPDLFFAELNRTLCSGGFSAHLFPLGHYIWEGHIHIPFAHWIGNRDLLRSYIRVMSRLGFGRYRDHHAALRVNLPGFAEQHADYILFFTRYMKYGEALGFAQKHQLRGSFRYTREYSTRKLRRMARPSQGFEYKFERSALGDWLSAMTLRYVDCVTLFLEKGIAYKHGTEERVAEALAHHGAE